MKLPRSVWVVTAFVGLTAAVASTARFGTDVARAEPGTLTPHVVARGIVVPIDGVAEVRATIEGRVLRVSVQEGDIVEAGQLLAEIDASSHDGEVRRREAELEAQLARAKVIGTGARYEERSALAAEARGARAELVLAQDRLARQKALHAKGTLSDAAVVEAEQAVRIAEARVQAALSRQRLAEAGGSADERRASESMVASARAALEVAKLESSKGRLVAPIAGRVLARRIDPGDTTSIGPGSVAAFDIGNPQKSEVRIEIEEADADDVGLGARVELRRRKGPAFATATVVRRSERMERRTIGIEDARTRADGVVRAVWAKWDQEATAALGSRYDAWIMRAPKVAEVTVPREAIAIRDGSAWVEVPLLLWSRAKRVELGVSDESRVEVRGLAPRERVLVPRLTAGSGAGAPSGS